MAVGTFDVRPGLNTLNYGLYGPRTVSGTAQFENSNACTDPEEHYANDIEMQNENLDGMDGEYRTNVHFGAMLSSLKNQMDNSLYL